MDSNFKPTNVKGTNDYLPEQMVIRNRAINILKTKFEQYGYLPIETSLLCHWDLLSYKYGGGAEILKEVYQFEDQGARKLGLRYDLTVPFSKVIAMNENIRLPFRRYEIGKVFRDGPVKLGRTREFYQCDVDVVGIGGQMVEAEFFKMAVDTYATLGIDIDIYFNNRKLLSGIMQECGVPKSYCAAAIQKVDALDKRSETEIRKEIEELVLYDENGKEILPTISNKSIDALFEIMKCNISQITTQYSNSTNTSTQDGLKEIHELLNFARALGIEDHCVFVPGLARGLEIYTGTVWEIYDKKRRINVALGGGGRYDRIITEFMDNEKEYPAVGMSFGLEPICVLLKQKEETTKSSIDIYIIPMGTQKECLQLADKLRNLNINVLVDMTNTKIKNALTYANKENIEWAIILGENEIQNRTFELKNMFNKENSKQISLDKLEEITIIK